MSYSNQSVLSTVKKYHPARVLTLVYQPFSFGTTAILVYSKSNINTRMRNLSGFTLLFLDLATSGKGGIGHYIGLCELAACFGLADGQVQGGMVGELSFMSPKFIQSYLAGLAASGALISFLRVLTILAFENSHDGLCKGASTVDMIPNRQSIDYAVDLFLISVVTLSIFPGFLYENTGSHQLGTWYPIVLIAMYNVVDFISNYIPLVKWLMLESRKALLTAVVSRFLFIPALYFTAKYVDQAWMIPLVSFLGLTNGYLTVCVLTVAPRGGMFAGIILD
ncbi:hypothetical protein RIF29_41515 [Crotalaria pallida]|uniref:Uncharacterized protein n=1 Tax=Crotalaria pallida TaxID=3830 RepID=A0AAN9HPF8_CROPI